MRKRRGSKTTKSKLLPTNAPFLFYDPLQQHFRQPRKGKLTVSLRENTLECEWKKISTKELQEAINTLTAEILKRAFVGDDEAIHTFAVNVSGHVSRLHDLTCKQREKVRQMAAAVPFWAVNITQRDTDFTWAQKHVRDLKVGSQSLLPQKIRSRIARHEPFARLAESLWIRLLENRHELPEWIDRVGSENARKLKTKWISLCLSLAAVERAQDVSAQDAPKWWRLGEALLQEAWEKDRQSAFGSVLPLYPIGQKKFRRVRGKTRSVTYTEAKARKAIFKQLRSAFLGLVKSGL